jgi:transposase
VIYEFCPGRGAQYPLAFLGGRGRHGRWSGTLLTDRYSAYETVVDPRLYPDRVGAACAAHARRNFEELTHDGTSVVGLEAVRRFARIYGVETQLQDLSDDARRAQRQQLARPLWEELKHWLQLERRLVADGGPTAKAIDYTLGHWAALTRHLDDGAVAIDNNHLERQIKPWAMGRRAWMFVGSELAGQRAAIVMSLVQSARRTAMTPGPTCATCCSACRRSAPARSRTCCRTDGSPRATQHHDLAHADRDGPGEHRRRPHERAAEG